MSTCAQAKAARRKAKHDERYTHRARKDASTSAEKYRRKVQAEQTRRMRKSHKG